MDTAVECTPTLLPSGLDSPSRTPTKNRSFSDPPAVAGTLAPSPTFRENLKSKDDHAVPTTPKPSRRPDFLSRGLSLQMPPPSPSYLQSPGFQSRVPLSPKLDNGSVFSYMRAPTGEGSPKTDLPRHSRGLDFSRACTNLHHSTLAEQSSPDSSPVITQKAMSIPSRRMSMSSMALDSPNVGGPGSGWGSLAPERSTVSSSVGSVNMLGSESENSDSDEDASMDGEDNDDPIFATPQVHKLQNPSAPTPFTAPLTPNGSGGGMWASGSNFSPAAQSLMKTIRRSRLQKSTKKSRKSSSSASGSGYSSLASPRTTSPPPMRSIESATNTGYFGWARAAQSRRESLALGTGELHLSSGNDSGDEAQLTAPSTPGVVRRPVTRRGNLLPKTKGFARIRAALQEEERPIDTETAREAETIRQVRERDNSISDLDLSSDRRPQTATAASSPSLLPAVPESAQEDFEEELSDPALSSTRGLGMNFGAHARTNGGGTEYWSRFDPSMRTPPPPPSFARQGSSVMSDMNMDSPGPQPGDNGFASRMRARAQSNASDASDAFRPAASAMNDDMHLKKFKRRREDDFDIATIKRRAVSPGMSAQNSPVLTQSPSQGDSRSGSGGGGWGQPPERKKENSSMSDGSQSEKLQQIRSGSNGSVNTPIGTPQLVASQGKKLGLQGMVDTNDGLMKMSIE